MWHDAYCQVEKKNLKFNPNLIVRFNTYLTNEEDDVINLK
jgi:hypothetical protein